MKTHARVAIAVAIAGWMLPSNGGMPLASAQTPGWCPLGGMPDQPGQAAATGCGKGDCDDPARRDLWLQGSSNPVTVRLKFNVFCQDAQMCAVSEQDVTDQLYVLNRDFQANKIEFVRPAPVDFIVDSRFYDFCGSESQYSTCICLVTCRSGSCQSEESAMKSLYADTPSQQLNIYVVDLDAHTGYIGLGYFPWCPESTDVIGGILIDKDYFGGVLDCKDGSGQDVDCGVLTHEIGHSLGLWHTHHGMTEVPQCSPCYEDADCGNYTCMDPECDEVGDLCCDTPPTPSNDECRDPTHYDWCVEKFLPPTDYTNFMGYGRDGCWSHFTYQQLRRTHCWTCDVLTGWLANNATGACCLSDSECLDTTQTCCANGGGTFYGTGTTCTAGACFMGDGTCRDLTQQCCGEAGGSFIGAGTTCDEAAPQWACCLPDACCVDATQSWCQQNGGMFWIGYTCSTPRFRCRTQTRAGSGG